MLLASTRISVGFRGARSIQRSRSAIQIRTPLVTPPWHGPSFRSPRNTMRVNFSAGNLSEAPSVLFMTGRLLTASAWALAMWFSFSLFKMQEEPSGTERKCETCKGTGKVECFCTRWSDGDRSGCGTCGGSLLADCPSCRGGGTAVPIEAKVYIRNEREYF